MERQCFSITPSQSYLATSPRLYTLENLEGKEQEESSGMIRSLGSTVGSKAASTFWKPSGYNIGMQRI
jgi:hypothetical protein